MSKNKKKKTNPKTKVNKSPAKAEPVSKKKIIIRRVLLGLFFTFGTVIIITAAFLLYLIFGSVNIDNTKPVNNSSEFLELYNQNEYERDLPEYLKITEQSLTIDTVNHTYTVTVALKCSSELEKPLSMQLFYTKEFEEFKGNIKNPFISFSENDGNVLSSEIQRYSVTGTYSKDIDISALEECLKEIYMEVKLGNEIGRIILPLDVYTE